MELVLGKLKKTRSNIEFLLTLEWASTENSLGQALMAEAERITGAQATDLLAQAVAAFRAALEVRTKADDALEWADTQVNLGVALWHQGRWSRGPEAEDLLAKATDAFRAALEVKTRQSLPQDWAATENNLGVAFADEAARVNGSQSADLMAKAADAFQAALEVRTRENLPQDWANTENNLAAALESQAEKAAGQKPLTCSPALWQHIARSSKFIPKQTCPRTGPQRSRIWQSPSTRGLSKAAERRLSNLLPSPLRPAGPRLRSSPGRRSPGVGNGSK